MLHCPFILIDIFCKPIVNFLFIFLYHCKFVAVNCWLIIRQKEWICDYDCFCIIKTGISYSMERMRMLYVMSERYCE